VTVRIRVLAVLRTSPHTEPMSHPRSIRHRRTLRGERPLTRFAALSLCVTAVACSRPAPHPAATTQPVAPVVAAPTAPSSAAPTPPRAPIPLPGRGTVEILGRSVPPTFQVEVARTELERTQGLMYRRVLGKGKGMVFFMPGDSDWSFYMRNTRLPLDIIFIDSAWRVVGLVANVPPMTLALRSVGAPSRYVLELDAHEAARHGIRAGTQLRFAASKTAP